jgi:outer membrane protein assembly factor BamB
MPSFFPQLLLTCGLPLAALSAADWPQFLGPTRNAIAAADEPALPDALPADLKPLWKKSVGSGFAGPVVVGDKVILFHREGSDMTTEAMETTTGKVLWRSTYVTDYVDSFGFDNGPRAVPAVADGRVFTYGPEGRVTALDLNTGRELWSYDTASALASPQGFFGRAPSPLVQGGRVIIAAGGSREGQDAGLVALEATTGKPAWTAVPDEAGYASPVAVGDHQILAWMRNRLWLVSAADGRILSSQPLRSRMDASVNAATPLPCGQGRWLVSAGYGVGAHLFRLEEGKIHPLWQRADLLDCHYATPVMVGGQIYGFHGRQETGMTLRCISPEGSIRWEAKEKLDGGTLIAVGSKLLILTEDGELRLLNATPEAQDLIATWQILRAGHRSHAAYASGIFYARDSEHLVAIRLR